MWENENKAHGLLGFPLVRKVRRQCPKLVRLYDGG